MVYYENYEGPFFLIFKGLKRVDTKVLTIPQSGFGKHFYAVKGCVMAAFSRETRDMKDSIPSDILYLV